MTGIERVRLLTGHDGPETAYVVSDHPYGYTLRCTIRYWIETADKGAKKQQQRFVSQATNPRKPGVYWNTPKASTYVALAVMYLDSDEHVQWSGVSHDFGVTPEQVARWRLNGIHDQLDGDARRVYETYVTISKRDLAAWDRFDATADAMAEHIRATGESPSIANGRWQSATGLQYLGDHADVYLAVARERADTPPDANT
jgi:hypothetical protein